MINNCNLNNLEACGLSVGGVKELYIVPFGSLYDYEYEDDNFGFISDFKSTNSFVEFKVQNAQFTQTSAVEDGRFYRNKFVFEVPKLAKEKRNEFERFIEKGVTYIFKDNNGKCWLIGREFPQKCTTLNASTGGDASLYRLEVDGLSRSQMQEVVCIDLGCFASFNGSFTTLSQFVVGNASTFDWSGLIQIVGGTNLYQYTPNQPLQPTLWSSDSSVNAQDAQEFLYLVGNNPAQTAVVLVYDSLNDNAFIQFYSNTFAYDNLTFNTQTPIDSTLSTTINLQLTLSQALSTSSTITVTDSSAAVVYSGAPDDIIGVGNSQINGMVSNAFIDAALYPNGTTFTAQVNGSDCETEFYEFVMPSVANCDLDVDSQFLWGLTYTIVIDKWDLDATYRKLKIVFGTWEFDIYPEYADYQSTFSVLEADLITAFTSNPNIPIDATTINITEQAKTFTIEFKGTESNLPFYAHTFGFTNSQQNLTYEYYGIESNLLNLQISATTNSYLEIGSTVGNAAGTYNNLPDSVNGWSTEVVPPITTGNTDDLAFVVDDYDEDLEYSIQSTNPNCPQQESEYTPNDCIEGVTINTDYVILSFLLNTTGPTDFNLGQSFEFKFASGSTTTIFTPTAIQGDDLTLLSEAVNDQLTDVEWLYGFYDANATAYWLFLKVKATDLIDEIKTTSATFNLDGEDPLALVEPYPILSPVAEVEYVFDNYLGPQTVNGDFKDPFYQFEDFTGNIANVFYDTVTGEATFTNTGVWQTDWTIDIFNQVPNTSTVPILTYNITGGSSVEDFVVDLANAGYLPTQVVSMRFRDVWGTESIIIWNTGIGEDENVPFELIYKRPVTWGRNYSFWTTIDDPDDFEVTTVVNSEICAPFNPNDLDGLLMWGDVTDYDSGDYKWDTLYEVENVGTEVLSNSNPIGRIVVGNYVRLAGGTGTVYEVVSIIGTDIKLDVVPSEPLGLYDIEVAVLTEMTDKSTYNRTVFTASTSTAPSFRKDSNIPFDSFFFRPEDRWRILDEIRPDSEPFELFAITRPNPLVSNRELYARRSNVTPYVMASFDGNYVLALTRDTNSNTASADESTGGVFPEFDLTEWFYELPNGNIQVALNANYGSPTALVTTGTYPSNREFIAAFNDGTTKDGYSGDMCEIIITKPLTTNERQKMEGYLAWKWGIEDKLPTSHPYRYLQP